MNIRPVDMQVLIPRATDVAKSQQITDQQTMQQQLECAADWKKISDDRQHQVQNTPKSEGGKVKAKTEQESHKQNRDFKEEHKEKAAKDSAAANGNHPSEEDPLRGHRIDIKM